MLTNFQQLMGAGQNLAIYKGDNPTYKVPVGQVILQMDKNNTAPGPFEYVFQRFWTQTTRNVSH